MGEPRGIDGLLARVRAGLARVGPLQARELAERDGVLVDIRPREQRGPDGEIPGALVIGRNVLEWRLDPSASSRLPEVDEGWYDRPVIVFCDEGYASSLAAEALQQLGLRGATDLEGGFQAWRAAGLPVQPGPPRI